MLHGKNKEEAAKEETHEYPVHVVASHTTFCQEDVHIGVHIQCLDWQLCDELSYYTDFA